MMPRDLNDDDDDEDPSDDDVNDEPMDHDEEMKKCFIMHETLPHTVYKALEKEGTYQPTTYELSVARQIKGFDGLQSKSVC